MTLREQLPHLAMRMRLFGEWKLLGELIGLTVAAGTPLDESELASLQDLDPETKQHVLRALDATLHLTLSDEQKAQPIADLLKRIYDTHPVRVLLGELESFRQNVIHRNQLVHAFGEREAPDVWQTRH